MTEVTRPAREAILRLQQSMLNDNPLDLSVACPVTHHFAPQVYAREMFLPKGLCIVGKIHKHAHMNTLSLGHVRVFTEEGLVEMQAPYSFISVPGTKRVVLAVEDTIWTTYHPNPTDTRDLAELEDQLIAKDYAQLELNWR